MKPDYETYTLTPKTPVSCDGIRVSGCAGGSAYFISCGELIVKAKQHPQPKQKLKQKRQLKIQLPKPKQKQLLKRL